MAKKLVDQLTPANVWADFAWNSASAGSQRVTWSVEMSPAGINVGSSGIAALAGSLDAAQVAVRWFNSLNSATSGIMVPARNFVLKDIYAVIRQVSNKVLVLLRDQAGAYSLNGAISSGATTITLNTTAGLPTTGTVAIDDESIEYSGIVGNQLVGCTRARNNTVAAPHTNGTRVFPCLWFIRFNGGAFCAGSTRPTA